LVQFDLVLHDRAAEQDDPPRIVREPLPPDTLVMGAYGLMRLLAISKPRAYHPIRHGVVPCVESTRRCYVRAGESYIADGPGTYRYAVVGGDMERWAHRHTRWLTLQEIDLTWVDEAAVAEAGRDGAFPIRAEAPHGQQIVSVRVGYDWLRWAAQQRPAEQMRQLVAGQITEEAEVGA
jgi:hypothetical protein